MEYVLKYVSILELIPKSLILPQRLKGSKIH